MKNIKIKEVMTPIEDYVTVKADQTLYDVFQILETNQQTTTRHLHRDVIVVDPAGDFLGKVTMLDIFRALEPGYKRLCKNYQDGILTKQYVLDMMREYDLWREPIKDLCERGSHIKIDDIMHTPDETEFLQEDESLEKALHVYVMGVHQPLIIKNNEEITGVLRFEDLYDVVRNNMLACPAP